MSVILKGVIKEEKDRLEKLQSSYLKLLDQLPKGSYRLRDLKGNKYCYQVYRDGDNVINEYLGNVNRQDVQEIIEKFGQAKKLKKQLKEVKESLKEIEKLLGGKSK
jgi:hypothetical protein